MGMGLNELLSAGQKQMAASLPLDFDIITDTEEHEGDYVAIQVVESPSFDAANVIVSGEVKDLTGLNEKLDPGFTLLGDFSKIKLTVGIVIAYKKG